MRKFLNSFCGFVCQDKAVLNYYYCTKRPSAISVAALMNKICRTFVLDNYKQHRSEWYCLYLVATGPQNWWHPRTGCTSSTFTVWKAGKWVRFTAFTVFLSSLNLVSLQGKDFKQLWLTVEKWHQKIWEYDIDKRFRIKETSVKTLLLYLGYLGQSQLGK